MTAMYNISFLATTNDPQDDTGPNIDIATFTVLLARASESESLVLSPIHIIHSVLSHSPPEINNYYGPWTEITLAFTCSKVGGQLLFLPWNLRPRTFVLESPGATKSNEPQDVELILRHTPRLLDIDLPFGIAALLRSN